MGAGARLYRQIQQAGESFLWAFFHFKVQALTEDDGESVCLHTSIRGDCNMDNKRQSKRQQSVGMAVREV